MADRDVCIEFALMHEDRLGLHQIVPDLPGHWTTQNGIKVWSGAHAVSGVNSASYPKQFAAIAALPQAERGPAVLDFYDTYEWDAGYAAIVSNEPAKRVFDMGVNSGERNAVRTLQIATTKLSVATLDLDGLWGPITLAAVNACDPMALVVAFQQSRVAFLKHWCANNPALPQLIARALE